MEVTGADPRHKRPLVGALSSESQELFFFSFYSCFIGLQVAVVFKRRTTLNTLVEILSALHLALFLCSV